MIVRLSRGWSFKDCAAYMLTDGNGSMTNDRVAHVETRNTITRNAHKAIRVMAAFALEAERLKKLRGIRGGRKQKRGPVLSMSLSWHPDEHPTKKDMVAAMDSAIAKLGLSKRQAVYVVHDDRDHAHIHAIVNLHSIRSGKIACLSHSKRKLSRWALEYEHQHGLHCAQRQANAEKIAAGKRAAYRDPVIYEAFKRAKSLTEFKDHLSEFGYRLARGRRLIVVTKAGRVENPLRHLPEEARGKLKKWKRTGDLSHVPKLEKSKSRKGANDNRARRRKNLRANFSP